MTFRNPRLTTVVATAGLAILVVLLYRNREITTWADEAPQWICGRWAIIEEQADSYSGIRKFDLQARRISFQVLEDGVFTEPKQSPIRKVSITTSANSSETGYMTIFYGEPDDDTITVQRLRLSYGPKQIVRVWQIVPTGWGEDRFFRVGDFIKTSRSTRK